MEKKNVHKDHRQRVRTRYRKSGIKDMTDHNILEFLLFYGVPYKDTNEIAHELTDKFGDLNGVLDAPIEELEKVAGIGENTAVMLKLIHDISVRYNEVKISRKTELAGEKRITDFLAMKYMGEVNEVAYLVVLDAHGRLERCVKLTEGDQTVASFNKRDIVKTALINNAKDVIIAHNHPKGFAVPSAADVKATKEIVALLRPVGVNVIDHIIVAEDGCFSMAENEKYNAIFIQ